MTTVFADTSFYVALLSSRDRFHLSAVEFISQFDGRIITTVWVLTELGNFLSRGAGRAVYVDFVSDLLNNRRVEVTEPSMQVFHRGLDLYAQRPDKEWSLTDCISIIVMQDCSLTHVLSADHHFEQAGFVCLLTP